MIKLQKYNTTNILLSPANLFIFINKFWEDIFDKLTSLDSHKHLYLMCRVKFVDTQLGYRTLGHLVKVNFKDKDLFVSYLQERLGILSDAYTVHAISSIEFSYIVRDGLVSEDDSRILFKNVVDKGLQLHTFNNKKLPISMIPTDYGNIILKAPIDNFIRYIVTDNIRTYQIDSYEDGNCNLVKILGMSKLEWKDTVLNLECNDSFKRDIGKSTIYFLDGEIILQKQERSAKPFKQLNQDKKIKNN